ncbi:MAG: beta-propeller fold lactonase family protein, partial [Saprospiraceae bacterium]|nr:beta-propeller fold lactonase family protein [Saprospiraceae bacterium]
MKQCLLLLTLLTLWAGCKKPESKPADMKLFIGTYTKKEGHVDGKAEGVYQYRMDALNGELSQVGVITGLVNPSFITASPDGHYLYAVEETG